MEIVRTEKEFTLESMPLDFLRRTLRIACADSAPLKFEENVFKVEISYKGVSPSGGSSVYPWRDEHLTRGYIKKVSSITITPTNGFDSFGRFYSDSLSIVGTFKESDRIVGSINTINWTNLLLEYGFLEIK